MTRGTSVCTIVRGRREHLCNLMRGLATQNEPPVELVIAYMQDAPHNGLPEMPFPVRCVHVSGEKMPLAAARNRAALKASGDVLVFLDVDCIPGPDLIAVYDRFARDTGGCVMGETRYLGDGDTVGREAGFDDLWSRAKTHPARRLPSDTPDCEPVDDHGELWGLSFALPRKHFDGVGGFDETFVGYGGEETDFAERLRDAGVPLFRVRQARAVHQWHPVHIPPLQHFDDIIRNARLFYEKRGRWCMEYWLGQFAERGLICWWDEGIRVIERPSHDAMASTRQPGDVRFS